VCYTVALRTREVDIRTALGAQKREIPELILRTSTRPVLAGLLVGVCLAIGASYLLRGVLYGLNPRWNLLRWRLPVVIRHRALRCLPAIAASYARRSDGGAQIRIVGLLLLAQLTLSGQCAFRGRCASISPEERPCSREEFWLHAKSPRRESGAWNAISGVPSGSPPIRK